jgi:2,3-dihydro-2,3-dihydroxybenzoate dehydrogenase
VIADLTGRVALVTGAASGIGRAVAQVLVEQGAAVHATDRDAHGLESLVAELGVDNARATTLDVTDADAVRAVADATAAELGRLDVLVCSAGVVVADDRPVARDTPADWEQCFAVNVRGTVHACEAALPHLRAAGDGAIVTIGSISAHGGRATLGAYPASKAAALRYTKGLALEVARDGIRVNAVCPGAVWSGIQARILAETRRAVATLDPDTEVAEPSAADETAFFAPYAAITPLGRPQRAVDVARAVAFLASADASEITGQCLHVDGGAIIRD